MILGWKSNNREDIYYTFRQKGVIIDAERWNGGDLIPLVLSPLLFIYGFSEGKCGTRLIKQLIHFAKLPGF